MRSRFGRILGAGLALIVVLGGCSSPDRPSQEEIMTSNDDARAEIRRLADEATQVLLASTADLELQEPASGVESWGSCTDDPFGRTNPPEFVYWEFDRGFVAPPDADVLARAALVVPALAERGWTPSRNIVSDFQRIERLSNDAGYTLSVTGQLAGEDYPPAFYVSVHSPCLPAPPDLDW